MPRVYAIASALLLLSAAGLPGSAWAQVREVREADGTVRFTNRTGEGPTARTVRDPDGSLRLVLRGGVECNPQPDRGQFDALFAQAEARHDVPAALLKTVARIESGFDPRARSRAGAQGLMQIMPATARELGVGDPFDPSQAIDGAARYLRGLLDRFSGDVRLALAAYNAGPAAVERHRDVPPYRETLGYVTRILELWGGGAAASFQLVPRS